MSKKRNIYRGHYEWWAYWQRTYSGCGYRRQWSFIGDEKTCEHHELLFRIRKKCPKCGQDEIYHRSHEIYGVNKSIPMIEERYE
jgi:hypothetical protein